jgi:MHS family proline/betaine transporter-like MFS transporter
LAALVGVEGAKPPAFLGPERTLTSSLRVVVAASVGNVLEWYDFVVFSFLAPQIAAAFFPEKSLLLTFATFGASFLARPIGAAVIGGYADRRGRRAALTLSIVLMGLGTLLMVVMPRYATIGAASAFGILLARLIQGFSAGGEFGGATALMIEHAPKRAGFFGSFQNTTQAIAAIMGSGIAWAVTAALPHAAIDSWGFRLPFVLGLLIAPVGFYIRRHVPETADLVAGAAESEPVIAVLTRYPARVLLGACTIAVGTASTYLNIYLPTYAQAHLHMASARSYGITFLVSCIPLFVTPFSGHLSDKVGRMKPMLICTSLLLVLSYPAFLLVVHDPTAAVLGCVLLVLTVLRSGYAAPMPTLLAEMFPAPVRGAGMSIAYTMGVVVFGGFAQFLMEWLIRITGSATVPGIYLAVTAAITLAALLAIRRVVPLGL